MNQPTELQSQAAAMTVIAELTRAAVLAGVTTAPSWWISPSGMVTGNLNATTVSGEAAALRALDVWRHLVGESGTGSYLYEGPTGPRRAYVVAVTIAEVSIRLTTSMSATAPVARTAVLV